MIEKSVELGATCLQPVLTRYTDIREINEDRIRAQICEAAEQCERLDMPTLSAARKLPDILASRDHPVPLLACIEREEGLPLKDAIGAMRSDTPCAFLIGPEGGFSEDEKGMLASCQYVRQISLGPHILRSETAALSVLTALKFS